MFFISFSSSDTVLANRIVADLQLANVPVWYAPTALPPGSNYAAEIPKAIRSCDALILIHSANANRSPHILRELEIALSLKKPIYPLRATEDPPLDAMEYYLSGVQWRQIDIDYERNMRLFTEFLAACQPPAETTLSIKPPPPVRNVAVEVGHEYGILSLAQPDAIEQLLSDAIAIDSQSYDDDFVGILDKCLAWYEANPEIYTFVTDVRGTVVGYVNAMPVEQGIYETMLGGDFFDNEIDPEAIIRPLFPGEFDLYFCSIGVDKSHRNTNLFRILFDAFVEKMHQWYDDGYIVRRLVSDAVTRDGDKMCNLIGCEKTKKTSHNSWIYTLPMLPPKIKPTTPRVRALIAKYREYHAQIS